MLNLLLLVLVGSAAALRGVRRQLDPPTSKAVVYKVPYNFIFVTSPIFKIFPDIFVPFPFSRLDILPNSLIIGKMILLPSSLFSTLYSSPLHSHIIPSKAMVYKVPYNFIFVQAPFFKNLDFLPVNFRPPPPHIPPQNKIQKKGPRFLCFSILSESICNYQNEQS